MIVPEHWAEARTQHHARGRQVTVRRFGWSDISEADAMAMAETRAAEALARILSGEKLDRRERKAAYNGAFGVPIREEVLSRHGEEVITRNAYGAHCLNTPRALFADIDFALPLQARPVVITLIFLALMAVIAGVQTRRFGVTIGLLFASFITAVPLATLGRRLLLAAQGGYKRRAERRIRRFLRQHPEWNLRIYQTPGGLRLLATHRPFDATAPEVQAFFTATGTDPTYRRMCLNQHCFRARLTAKPWRIGIQAHMRPRPGVWPVRPERMPIRQQWVSRYELAASRHAACRFIGSQGSGVVDDSLRAVIELHDRESRATSAGLVIA